MHLFTYLHLGINGRQVILGSVVVPEQRGGGAQVARRGRRPQQRAPVRGARQQLVRVAVEAVYLARCVQARVAGLDLFD